MRRLARDQGGQDSSQRLADRRIILGGLASEEVKGERWRLEPCQANGEGSTTGSAAVCREAPATNYVRLR